MSAAETRGAGICVRCQRYTREGVVRLVDQGSNAGHRVVRCRDEAECADRRAGRS